MLKEWLEKRLVEIVNDEYRHWHEANAQGGARLPEPTLSARDLRDHVNMYKVPRDWEFMTPNHQYERVYQALNRLTRRGELESSLACVKGREVRCWNPTNN